MDAIQREQLAIWLKQREIESLQRKPETSSEDLRRWAYFDGKAQAFSEVWERIVADGKPLHPTQYNVLNDEYSRKAAEGATHE